jgi:hypothetical protein
MRIILAGLGLPQRGPTTLFEDNETCQKMTDSLVASPRMQHAQHLDARYHWLREQVVHDWTLRLVYCNTPDQVADCPTKRLPGPAIARFHGALSGRSPIALGTRLPPLEVLMVALDKVCFALRSSRFCLI